MTLQLSYRPLTPEEWIEYLSADARALIPILLDEKMPVCYDVVWEYDGPDGLLCSMTGSYLKGNKLVFTFMRSAPQSVSYTYSEVLEILKKDKGREIVLFDLDKNIEVPAYYGCSPGLAFFSVIAGKKPE